MVLLRSPHAPHWRAGVQLIIFRPQSFKAMRRRNFLLAALWSCSAFRGGAQNVWPVRVSRFIVPFSPGGALDTPARMIAQQLGTILGTTFVVENRAGAGGAIGAQAQSASEIAQLKLDADWAVLSACNTAAEDKPGAEALSGLARAFFYAGARSLVVSHWAVSDEATARLMIGTFRASARDLKLSHAEALQQSMLAMIDAAKSDAEADPRLWAPFVVVGEPAKTY